MGAVSSACSPHCNCGRGERNVPSSRVNWSRQNYDVSGGSPTAPFAEEPLDADIWDAGLQHVKAEDACRPEAHEKFDRLVAHREDQASVLEADPWKDGATEPGKSTLADTTEENLTSAVADISLLADVTDGPQSVYDDPAVVTGSPREEIPETKHPPKRDISFRQAVKKAMLARDAGAKVALDNKIGVKPEGWFRDVCLELQRGIASEGRSEPHKPGFELPQKQLFARCRVACGFPLIRYYATMGLQDGLAEPSLYMVGKQDAAGKSGAFFFLSPDQQLMAKSCTLEDWHALLRILPDYVEYVEAARRRAETKEKSASSKPRMTSDEGKVSGFIETLLPRFLGLYSLTLDGDPKPVRMLVMANVFGGALSIDRRYDLKGSTHGRISSAKEKAKKSPTFKDLDWIKQESALVLSEVQRTQLLESIDLDLKFLSKHGLMDYSLLVGVHDLSGASEKYEAMNVVTVRDQTRHCYLGIIDVLTPYLFRKRLETFFLGTIVCGRDISCQHPQVYARRFQKYVTSAVFAAA